MAEAVLPGTGYGRGRGGKAMFKGQASRKSCARHLHTQMKAGEGGGGRVCSGRCWEGEVGKGGGREGRVAAGREGGGREK